MFQYIRKKREKSLQKKTFKEYGFEVQGFDVEGFGHIDFAQWLHPSEDPKNITASKIHFFQRITPPGAMVIDIGTHTGDTTVPMAYAVGKEGLVLGLEPNPYVYKILQKNVLLNTEKTNIVPLCFAATDKDGEYTFNYSDASFCNGGFLSKIHKKRHGHHFTLNVKGKNLQDYLYTNHKNDLKRLKLIKIDTEGYDKEILKTIPKILMDIKPHLMVECYKRLNLEERNELFDILDKFEYQLFLLEDFEDFSKLKQINKSNMTDRKHFDILAIHASKQGSNF